MDVSVIIPAYNEESYLPQTIGAIKSSILELPQLEWEIIVVDNVSTDLTSQIAEELGARVVLEANRGISKARNRGAKHASGKILVFVDADTIVLPKLMRAALAAFESSVCGGVGATLKFDQTHGRVFFGVFVPGLWNVISKTLKLAAGSFIVCRNEDFKRVGGFPDDFYAGEEIFFVRALKKHLKRSKKKFIILDEYPVITSSRKLLWHSGFKISSIILMLLLFPFAVKSRRLCAFWYNRPS